MALFSTDLNNAVTWAGVSAQNGVATTPGKAEFSYAKLETERLAVEKTIAKSQRDYELLIDQGANRVILTLPNDASTYSTTAIGPRVSVRYSATVQHGFPAACTDRMNCGRPLRGGVNIGRFVSGNTFVWL